MKGNEYNTALVKNAKTNELERICLETGEVLAELKRDDMSKYRFNFDTALLICQRIREGYTLKKLGEDTSLPSLPVIHYWRRTNATFDEEIKLARKDRAEYYHDKVIEIADEVEERDDVPVAKFKTDAYRWAAEKGDPASYGNKIEHTGNNTAPAIVVVTGISRAPDVEVEYEKVSDTGRNDEQDEASQQGRILGDMREGTAETGDAGGSPLPNPEEKEEEIKE